MHKIRSFQGELNRLASIPSGKNHWNWSDKPNVLTLHRRIHREYGPAKNFKCVDCNEEAKDWSLNKGKQYTDGKKAFSPRCRKCHVKYDGTGEKNRIRLKGKPGHMKGYKHSLQSRKNMSLAHLGKPSLKKGKHYK